MKSLNSLWLNSLIIVLLAAGPVVVSGCKEHEDPAAGKEGAKVIEPTDDPPPVADPKGEKKVFAFTPNSGIMFTGSKTMFGKQGEDHTGSFPDFKGTVTIYGDDLSTMAVEFSVDTTTMATDNGYLTTVPSGDNFFDVEKFPTATFKSVSVEKAEEEPAEEAESSVLEEAPGVKVKVTGDLTLKDVTKRIELAKVDVNGGMLTSAAEFVIPKSAWGWDYDGPIPGTKIKDEIVIMYEMEAEIQAEADAPADAA